MPEAVIVAAARSPIGRARKGSLKDIRPDDLAAQMVQGSLDQVPELDPTTLDDIQLGVGLPEGIQGANLARIVAVRLGLDTVPGSTVNRFCASSIHTTRNAFHAVLSGESRAVVSAGVESLTMVPGKFIDDELRDPLYQDAWKRTARRATREIPAPWHDPREDGELPDPYILMGQTAENVAELRGVSKRAQDEYAVRSQNRAEAAIASGFFERDITPVTTPDGTVVTTDDSPRAGVTLEAVSGLDPVFRPDGTVTAGNCCPLSDGAAALVVMDSDHAKDLGITPLARILATGVFHLGAAGLEHPSQLGPEHILRRVSQTEVRSLASLYRFLEPGELLDKVPEHAVLRAFWPLARADSFVPPDRAMEMRRSKVM